MALDLLFLSRSSRLSASHARGPRSQNCKFSQRPSLTLITRGPWFPCSSFSLSDLDASHPDDMVKVLLGVLMLLNGLGGALAAVRGGASIVFGFQRRRGDGGLLVRRTEPSVSMTRRTMADTFHLQLTTTAVRPFLRLNPILFQEGQRFTCLSRLAVIATTSIDEQAKSQDLSLKEVCYMALYKEEGKCSHLGCTDVERPAVPQFSR